MADQGYFRQLAELAASAPPSVDPAAVEKAQRRMERQRREERLADNALFAGPAITPDDKLAILRGTLNRKVHSLNVVMSWRERFRGIRPGVHVPIVALLGPRGRGKTVAGAWLIAEEGGHYVSALDLCKRLLSGHWKDSSWSDQVLRSRVVVLDDVGTEPEKDRNDAMAAMFEFVNRRQALARGLTLITANLTRADFDERYGERTVDRIMHVGVFVEAKGEDLRRKA